MASDYDDKYVALMGRYKQLRTELGEKADLYLVAANKLRETGKVSEDAILGAAYL
jgi:hypothetical protein